MLRPHFRAVRGGPEEESRGRVSSSARHSWLQLLTHMGCRDLSGFRAKLGHMDLSRSKDAPVHNTHIKRVGGYFSPCPSALGYRSNPHNSAPCCAPCFRPYSPTRRAPISRMKTQPPFPISLQPGASPGAPSRSRVSIPRRVLVSPRVTACPQPAGSPPALALPEHRRREERSLHVRVHRDGGDSQGYPGGRAPCQHLI